MQCAIEELKIGRLATRNNLKQAARWARDAFDAHPLLLQFPVLLRSHSEVQLFWFTRGSDRPRSDGPQKLAFSAANLGFQYLIGLRVAKEEDFAVLPAAPIMAE